MQDWLMAEIQPLLMRYEAFDSFWANLLHQYYFLSFNLDDFSLFSHSSILAFSVL